MALWAAAFTGWMTTEATLANRPARPLQDKAWRRREISFWHAP
jgi:hypothetical protein